jgi:hypothetical protein
MGHRANLLIVKDRRYELYYSHWGAVSLDRDLFWGPEHALAYIQMQRRVDGAGWLDNVWAEGGAVLDLDVKALLLFGGGDLSYDVPLRRTYLSLLSEVWAGWHIRWAHEGIADLADWVSYSRDQVFDSEGALDSSCDLSPPECEEWTDCVGSVAFRDHRIRFYPLVLDPEPYLLSGLSLLSAAADRPGLERLPLDEWTQEFPKGGFHIEESKQTIEFWTAYKSPDIEARLARRWPGWNIKWCWDLYESQLARTRGLLRLPLPSDQSLEGTIRSRLLAADTASPVQGFQELCERERREGKDVQINPYALRDDRLPISLEDRRRILEAAFSSLHRNRDSIGPSTRS